jgi:glucokinase
MHLAEKPHMIHTRHERLKETYALALDVGGTYLKSAAISTSGKILRGTRRKIRVDSQGSRQEIIEAFVRALKPNLEILRKHKLEMSGIGVGMPGPFDYERGVSLMKHKFKAVYGLNLRNTLIRRLGLKRKVLVQFENDAATFLRGESWSGAAQRCRRIVGITLGTGLGSAFMINNHIVEKGPGIPPHGAWCLPYKGGIAEDRISRRGILARYKTLVGQKWSERLDVEDIAIQGLKHRDRISVQVFEELGDTLGQVLLPVLTEFEADCLLLGGQISKSFQLFSAPLKRQLQDVSSLKKVTRGRSIDSSPLYGAAKLVFQSIESKCDTPES